MRTRMFLALCCVAFASAALAADDVTLLHGARIVTVDATLPFAQAMAFDADGKILALGGEDELAQRYPDAKPIDARGSTVIPGLIDAHGHILGLGLGLMQAQLEGTRSKDEVVARLREFAKDLPEGEWLLGRGWDQNDWDEKKFPSAADLDVAFPTRPVWIERVDGHAAWANSAALKFVKRDLAGDWQPGGGRIERVDGKATGVFVDGAMNLVSEVVPQTSPATADRALGRAFDAAVSAGLTGVHDMGTSRETLALMRARADAGTLPLRITAYADGDGSAFEDLCSKGLYEHAGGRLQMRGVKLYADGALGSRGAALLADYDDDRGNKGLLVTEPDALAQSIAHAKRCGVQVAVHAIGDRGNRAVLDAYGKALGEPAAAHPAGDRSPKGRETLRWRIEHAQLVALEDIPRFATLGVIASMQPTHATSDMPWAEARVGAQRIAGAYAWRKFRDAGVRLAFGSDFPVESVDPRLGLYAAVTRQDASGTPAGGWYANERVTAWEALRGFTLDAAYAGFAEGSVGSLAVGKRADFVILSVDPLAVAPKELLAMKVIATYVDGKVVSTAP